MDTFGTVYSNRIVFENAFTRGEWAPNEVYQLGNIITLGSDLFRASINHISTSFSVDLSVGRVIPDCGARA